MGRKEAVGALARETELTSKTPTVLWYLKKQKHLLIKKKKSVLENVYILPEFASYTIKHIKIILEKNSSNFRAFPEVLFRATEAVALINRSLLNIKGLLV